MKKIFIFLFLMFSLFFLNINIYGDSFDGTVLVSGSSIGIKLDSDVLVLGTYGIEYNGEIHTPWLDKVKEKDIIKKIDNIDVTNGDMLMDYVYKSNGRTITLELLRDGKIVSEQLKPVLKGNKYSLGLYIKDYEMGIGTLTFLEPKTKKFASLGHQMTDKELYSGSVYKASVDSIVFPRDNQAGEKKATIFGKKEGYVNLQNNMGVYGVMEGDYYSSSSRLMKVSKASDVKMGEAYILTSTKGVMVKEYKIEITEAHIQTKPQIKGIKFKVVDSNLINEAGGIVQGMSGSPIIQNDKLVGAVTHVTLKNPKEGYGLYAEFMLNNIGFNL